MGLFKPAWRNKNIQKAQSAVEKMTSQRKLAKVAEDYDAKSEIRICAIRKIEDQTVLANIARSLRVWDSEVALAAKKLTDQVLLADVAMNSKSGYARAIAINKLTDQTLIADIVKSQHYPPASMLDKIINQNILSDIAQNAQSPEVRFLAAERLTDRAFAEKLYPNIAKCGYKDAVQKITDQSILAEIIKDSRNIDVRIAALNGISDPCILNGDLRIVLAEIAKTSKNLLSPKLVIDKLTDQALLADVAENAVDCSFKAFAIDKLTDEEIILKLAKKETNEYVCYTIIKKIKSKHLIYPIFSVRFCNRGVHIWEVLESHYDPYGGYNDNGSTTKLKKCLICGKTHVSEG